MRTIRTTQPSGKITNEDGPTYRRNIAQSVRDMLGKGEAPPFTEEEAKRLQLTDLVARDNAWAAVHRPGYRVEVVQVEA